MLVKLIVVLIIVVQAAWCEYESVKTKITRGIDPIVKSTVLHKASKSDNNTQDIVMPKRKRIALVAHDNKKAEFIDCLKQHRKVLSQHELFGTGSTAALVEKELNLTVTKYRSGPVGGDQQLGAKIASQQLDMLLFLIDPLYSHPHIDDIHAVVRLAEVWNVVCATTTTSIDFVLTSPRMNQSNTRHVNLTPGVPTTVKREEKPTSFQTRRVPNMNDELKFILARLLSKK